jgi:hypothetical protein
MPQCKVLIGESTAISNEISATPGIIPEMREKRMDVKCKFL